MKTKFLLFAMFMTMSVAAFANGGDGPEMTIIANKDSEVFKVIYKGTTSGRVKLNILDSRGRTIHTSSFPGTEGFICPLNFKGLPSGSYTIEVADNQGIHQEKVEYVSVYDRKRIHMSRLLDEERKFLFTIANAQSEPLTIRIYDEHRKLLYSASRTLTGDFAQVFRVAHDSDHYTFQISDAAGNVKVFAF